MFLRISYFALVLFAFLLVSCASTKPAETVAPKTADTTSQNSVPDSAIATAPAEEPLPEGNKDVAHESFLRYLYLQQRGEAEIAIVFLQHAAEADPANRYLAFTLAEELSEREQYDMAMNVAERAKKLPGASNAAEEGLLASLYLRTGKLDSAKVYYKKSIASNDEDYTKIYEYSLFLEWEEPKDFDELLRVYGMLLPRINYMQNMFSRTAQIMLQNGKDSAFCALLTDAFNATHNPSFMMDKFHYYDEKKMKDSAFAALETLHREVPDDTTGLKLYGATLITENRPSEASAAIAEYRNSHEAVPSIIYLQGLATRGENKLDSATKFFNEIANDPKFGHQAHAQLSFIAVTMNDTLSAVREIEIADSLSPGDYFIDKLRRYMAYGMTEKSFPMLDSLLAKEYATMKSDSLDQNVRDAAKERYYGLLAINADMHARYASKFIYSDSSVAEEHYKKAAESTDLYLLNNPAANDMKFLRASILERRKFVDEAIAAFKDLLKADPKNHMVLNYLGYSLIDLARTPEEVREGVVLVDSALVLDPENVSYLDSKAWGLFRLGMFKEAKDVMTSLPVKLPAIFKDYSYWEHLGRILDALGETEAAADCFDKLYELQPKHPFAKKK